MSTQHTPGPWVIDEVSDGYKAKHKTVIVRARKGTTSICAINFPALAYVNNDNSPRYTDEAQANAALIAAAPDMLEALKAIYEHRQKECLDNDVYPYNLLQPAIAKTEGRT